MAKPLQGYKCAYCITICAFFKESSGEFFVDKDRKHSNQNGRFSYLSLVDFRVI